MKGSATAGSLFTFSFFMPQSSLAKLALLIGALVTVARLSLLGTGTMAFVDEYRYVTAMLGLRALGEGHGLAFLQAINSMGARPGDGLWRAIPGLGQALLLLGFGLNPNAPPSLQVPQLFNVLIVSLNALLLYRIYRQFFSFGFALLGIVAYSSLVNTNLYLRHLLPYDHALFFFLLALWWLLSQSKGRVIGRYCGVGALSGLSYAVYPGYFMGPAVLLALGLLLLAWGPQTPAGQSRPRVVGYAVAQLAGLLGVLGLFEILARLSGTSYLASSRYIATTINQGSFEEGLSFTSTYFWQVEGWVGVGLLTLCGAGLVLSAWELFQVLIRREQGPAQSESLPLAGLLVISLLAWLGYVGLVLLAHKLVFYGRILHFFVPFIVLGALVAVRAAASLYEAGKRVLLVSCYVAVCGHFATFFVAYRAVQYPCDVAYRYGIQDARQIAGITTTGRDDNVIFYRVFGPRIRNQRTVALPAYQLVNFAYLYPLSGYRPASFKADKILVSVPYFLRYSPYRFEGHNPVQRTLLQKYAYEFQIIKTD